ncbi:MAG: hypothetical protein E4G92_04805, partial [Bacteroidia bacterium]
MKKSRLFTCLMFMSLTLIIFPFVSSAQVSSVSGNEGSDATIRVKNESSHSLYAGIGWANNMNYMGSALAQEKPLVSGSLTYGFKEELFASISANHLSAFDPLLAFSTFSLSYNHDINSWFDISAGLSRYQVNNELTDTLFNNFFYGSLAVGLDWKILYTNLSLGGIFSESSRAYVQVRNSRYFETPAFLMGKTYVSFDPYVNLMLGTLTKTVTSDGTSIGVSSPFRAPKSSGQGSGMSTTTFFGVMEVDFGVPVGINSGNLTIEVEPGYVLPTYSDTDIQTPKGFTLFL